MSLQPERVRGHARAASGDERRRVAIPRRSTRGPLDIEVDDPLSPAAADDPLSASQPASPPTGPQTTNTQRVLSPTRGLSEHHDGPSSNIPDVPAKDFSFLQDPSAYHALPTNSTVPPGDQPSLSTPLETLLSSGYFRLAAIAAARQIVQHTSPSDYPTLLRLLHVRLACLMLLNEHALAAHECKALGDLNSAFYRHPLTDAHLVPWDLRVLCVRLGALGYGEWRRGVMGFYELAGECRENFLKAATESDGEGKELWRTRLRECGIRVANILIEMGDLESAGQHLATLSSLPSIVDTPQAQEILYIETLVWLRVGDLEAARRCLEAASLSTAEENDDLASGTLQALVSLATGDLPTAISQFEALHSTHPSNAMITQNLAVCLLYTGNMAQARSLLEGLSDTSVPFHSLLFNLSTIYELCTERSREKKTALAAKIASRGAKEADSEGEDARVFGWEVGNASFKL